MNQFEGVGIGGVAGLLTGGVAGIFLGGLLGAKIGAAVGSVIGGIVGYEVTTATAPGGAVSNLAQDSIAAGLDPFASPSEQQAALLAESERIAAEVAAASAAANGN